MDDTVPAKLVMLPESDLVRRGGANVSLSRIGLLFPTGLQAVIRRNDGSAEVQTISPGQLHNRSIINGHIQVPRYLFEAADAQPPDTETLERDLPAFIAGVLVPDPLGLADPRPLGPILK